MKMINYIWGGMVLIGIIAGFITGNVQNLTDAVVKYAELAVTLSIGLIGIMSFWLGLMAIAEKAGLVQLLGRALRPVLKYLFPDIPKDHPALGTIVMNMAANILGLGNASTPLGIKAMEELQEINIKKDTASNSMCMLLAINTSSVQLICASVIAYRVSAGSANPTEIIGPTIFATIISTIVAIVSAKILEKLPIFRYSPVIDILPSGTEQTKSKSILRFIPIIRHFIIHKNNKKDL
jgi:spore maturation protein A